MRLAGHDRDKLRGLGVEPAEVEPLEPRVVPDPVGDLVEASALRVAPGVAVVNLGEQRGVEEVRLRGEGRCLDLGEDQLR